MNRTRPSRDSSADEDGGSVAPERVEPVYNPNDVRVQFVRSNAQTSSSHDNDSRSSPSSRSSSANELGGEGAVLKSTLLSGKASLFDELESDLAAFKKEEAAVIAWLQAREIAAAVSMRPLLARESERRDPSCTDCGFLRRHCLPRVVPHRSRTKGL